MLIRLFVRTFEYISKQMYTACNFSLFLLKFVLLEFSLFEIFLKSQLDSPDIFSGSQNNSCENLIEISIRIVNMWS